MSHTTFCGFWPFSRACTIAKRWTAAQRRWSSNLPTHKRTRSRRKSITCTRPCWPPSKRRRHRPPIQWSHCRRAPASTIRWPIRWRRTAPPPPRPACSDRCKRTASCCRPPHRSPPIRRWWRTRRRRATRTLAPTRCPRRRCSSCSRCKRSACNNSYFMVSIAGDSWGKKFRRRFANKYALISHDANCCVLSGLNGAGSEASTSPMANGTSATHSNLLQPISMQNLLAMACMGQSSLNPTASSQTISTAPLSTTPSLCKPKSDRFAIFAAFLLEFNAFVSFWINRAITRLHNHSNHTTIRQ